jgi:hypothetical protein
VKLNINKQLIVIMYIKILDIFDSN